MSERAPEPTGVTVHDPRTGTLRHDEEWTVVDDDGSLRTLRLRVGRGYLKEIHGRVKRWSPYNPDWVA